ncbi:hypothetical protein AVEN_142839-1 [Araneus ventricosus]|uniref:Uncharacterized protein n=1 Tax=Araneus ventricosus TaxID=182803 RepID=A0A4Y2XCM0_ARAVE|nr:hypothetical protein AVEN_142839-1 [Araneus ventricosus]
MRLQDERFTNCSQASGSQVWMGFRSNQILVRRAEWALQFTLGHVQLGLLATLLRSSKVKSANQGVFQINRFHRTALHWRLTSDD